MYDNAQAANAFVGYDQGPAPDQTSLASLMSNLDEQVKRARSVAAGTDRLVSQIYGPRPQSVGENAKPTTNSLESLIANLAMALTEAEMNLGRL